MIVEEIEAKAGGMAPMQLNQNTNPTVQRRAYYRVVYPADKRPVWNWAGKSYEIVDICEAGIKFLTKNSRIQDDILKGTVVFRDGETIEVVGRVVRVEKETIALHLVKTIPYKNIHQEQVNLRMAM
jgi:hypothetical protein